MLDDRMEECKRKPIELNLAAAKKRKSAQTGFIHHCYTSLPEERQDTIPVYENCCYALALLRSRLSDHVLEAKVLLEKLIAFEVGGNFPVYLHDYPMCHDRSLSLHVLPVFHWVLADFRAVLGENFCRQLEGVIERILIHADRVDRERPLPPTAWAKWKAYANPQEIIEIPCRSAAEWADYIIALQMSHSRGADISDLLRSAQEFWHPHLHLFLGSNRQEKGEPETTLLDLLFGVSQHSYSQRTLLEHPIHLRAALVYPFPLSLAEKDEHFTQLLLDDPRQGYALFWGGASKLHSLVCDHGSSSMQTQLSPDGAQLLITLPEHWESSEQPEIPLSLFFNIAEGLSISINGQKATTFQLGDEVRIDSEEKTITLQLSCVEGEGVFFGHLLRANRPTQQSCAGVLRFEAYDWQLALRTVRRSLHCKILVTLKRELHNSLDR